MEIPSALALVSQVTYKPGWSISATDHSGRTEAAIRLRVDYPTRNSNRDQAARGYPELVTVSVAFPVVIKDFTEEDLYAAVLDQLLKIEEHEAREFMRVAPAGWAPFHPHRVDGMRRWAARSGAPDISSDLHFGSA